MQTNTNPQQPIGPGVSPKGRIFSIGLMVAGLTTYFIGGLRYGQLDKTAILMLTGISFAVCGFILFVHSFPKKPAPTRNIAQDRTAVSPVIGVILMVAITVVFAAIVFVLVSNLSKNSSTAAPTIALNADDPHHTLTVIQADPAADWSQVAAKLTGTTGCTYKLNTGTAGTAARVTASTQQVLAGDVLTVAGGGGASCTLSLSYASANQLLGSWTFTF